MTITELRDIVSYSRELHRANIQIYALQNDWTGVSYSRGYYDCLGQILTFLEEPSPQAVPPSPARRGAGGEAT